MAPRAQAGWHPEQIKAAIRQACGPVTRVSIEWGFSKTAISSALRRPDYSMVIEKRIAEALGVSLHELWPSRWAPDGAALPRHSGEFKPIETSRVRTSQIGKVA